MHLIPHAFLMHKGSSCMMLLRCSLRQLLSMPTNCNHGKPIASKLQSVMVTLVSAHAKRAAFKAWGQLRQKRLRLGDDLQRPNRRDAVSGG